MLSNGPEPAAARRSEVRGSDPEHLALGVLGVEPEQGQVRIGSLEIVAAAADLAEQPALWGQMLPGLVQQAADDIEPVSAAIEPALCRR